MHIASRKRRGSMLILVAIVMVIFVAMTVISVDVAKMHLVQTELRTAADAASRAASEALVRTQDVASARSAALNAAQNNLVNGQPFLLAAEDVVFGSARQTAAGTFSFQPNQNPTNAIRVNARRTSDSPSGSVPLFLGAVLGTGSFEPTQASTSTAFVRDIALVLDRSGSMGGSKLAALKNGVREFVSILETTPADERISLSTYASTSQKDIPMSGVFAGLRQKNEEMLAGGATAIGEGLQDGLESLANDPLSRGLAEKTVVLMTDGRENTGVSVLDVAIPADFTVHTITFGDGADQVLMQTVADSANGIHIHADSNGDLKEAFKKIAETLSVVLIE